MRIAALFLICCVGLPVQLTLADNAVSREARALIAAHQWDRAAEILERRLRTHPHDISSWNELSSISEVARPWVLRRAFEFNPEEPQLLLALARTMSHPGAAMEVFAKLARVPQYREQAEHLSEFARLGLNYHYQINFDDPEIRCQWFDGLFTAGHPDRARVILDEGLRLSPDDDDLLARKAMVLALDGDFEKAMRLQRRSGYQQIIIQGSYFGIADCFLCKEQPELAVRSFGGSRIALPPTDSPDWSTIGLRQLLADAYAQTRRVDEARRILTPRADVRDNLLLLRAYLRAGKMRDALELGDKIVEPLEEPGGISAYGGPVLWQEGGPVSLREAGISVLPWLWDHFPRKRAGIAFWVGSPGMRRQIDHLQWTNIPSNDEMMAKIQSELAAAATDDERARLRRDLARVLDESGKYQEAANTLIPLAILPVQRNALYKGAPNFDAIQWSLINLRAKTEAEFVREPDRLLSVIGPLNELWKEHFPPYTSANWHLDSEVRKAINAGPGVLSMACFNSSGSSELRPFVAIFAELGGPQEFPIFIDALASRLRSGSNPSYRPLPLTELNNDPSAQMMEECLEKFTGKHPPDNADLLAFWNNWWDSNARRVVVPAPAR